MANLVLNPSMKLLLAAGSLRPVDKRVLTLRPICSCLSMVYPEITFILPDSTSQY